MKQTKYPVERIIQILSEAELPGHSIAEVCRKYSVSRSTFDKWKQKFKGMSSNEAKRLKVLEDENNRLKRILAEAEQDKTLAATIREIAFKYTFYGYRRIHTLSIELALS